VPAQPPLAIHNMADPPYAVLALSVQPLPADGVDHPFGMALADGAPTAGENQELKAPHVRVAPHTSYPPGCNHLTSFAAATVGSHTSPILSRGTPRMAATSPTPTTPEKSRQVPEPGMPPLH